MVTNVKRVSDKEPLKEKEKRERETDQSVIIITVINGGKHPLG